MNIVVRNLLVLMCAVGMTASAMAMELSAESVERLGIKNLQVPQETSFVSGQPSQEQLKGLFDAGVKHVINLRPDSEMDWDEQAAVEALGMQYHSLPIAGKAGITKNNAIALDELMASLEGEPLLLHCSSGNRAGGLMALAAFHVDAASLEPAIKQGQAWGLTRLEPFVRQTLSQ